MKVTLEELQQLRSTLTAHRLEHETLVTQMQVLRHHCRQLREEIAATISTRHAAADECGLAGASPGEGVA